eukprot:CAMPEP_0181096458 /NCGR_PEP_ID=MMETSP1071-20121207/11044_1 /TAXON_ID=35127 /ORGANISM="Thalassiosira sp., Strain NH16" /LENGTH=152 /DNA_ID=CAMNT_0023178869 /DNA_START=54 /DNA_END=512 /DNA_ORIENTATION=+
MTFRREKCTAGTTSSGRTIRKHALVASSYRNLLKRAVFILTSIIGGLVAARHLASKTIGQLPYRLPTLSSLPLSSNHERWHNNMPSTNAPSHHAIITPKLSTASDIRGKIKIKSEQLANQDERLRQVREENEELRNLIKMLKETKVADGELQ